MAEAEEVRGERPVGRDTQVLRQAGEGQEESTHHHGEHLGSGQAARAL